MRERVKRGWIWPLALLAAAAIALDVASVGSAAEPPAGFVQASGGILTLNGQPYRFTGINIYNAANASGCWYSMAGGSTLDDSLSAISAAGGPKVMRAWFFQGLATTSGARDWTAFDHTLAVAAAHGTRVIVTLANQWPDCDGLDGGPGRYKDDAWYANGYKQVDPLSGTVSYRDWVAEIVARYKDDPTILAWQLMNEAEVKPSESSSTCSANAAALLKNFAADVSGLVKSIDPNHLVSLGTIGGGQCGTQGAEYKDVYSVPTIDLCEYHDYGSPNTPMPGDAYNGLQVRLNQCQELGKPLFVGETGITAPGEASSPAVRAADFRSKFARQFAGGVAGELVWAWDKDGSVGSYDIGPGDPTLAVLDQPVAPAVPWLAWKGEQVKLVSCDVPVDTPSDASFVVDDWSGDAGAAPVLAGNETSWYRADGSLCVSEHIASTGAGLASVRVAVPAYDPADWPAFAPQLAVAWMSLQSPTLQGGGSGVFTGGGPPAPLAVQVKGTFPTPAGEVTLPDDWPSFAASYAAHSSDWDVHGATGSTATGPYDPWRPETLLLDGVLSAGDAPMPPARVDLLIADGGFGSFAATAKASDGSDPFGSAFLAAADAPSAQASGVDGSAHFLTDGRNDDGSYAFWQFAATVGPGDGFNNCKDAAGQYYPLGAFNQVAVYSDEHGEARVGFDPTGVTRAADAIGRCDPGPIPGVARVLANASVTAAVSYPYGSAARPLVSAPLTFVRQSLEGAGVACLPKAQNEWYCVMTMQAESGAPIQGRVEFDAQAFSGPSPAITADFTAFGGYDTRGQTLVSADSNFVSLLAGPNGEAGVDVHSSTLQPFDVEVEEVDTRNNGAGIYRSVIVDPTIVSQTTVTVPPGGTASAPGVVQTALTTPVGGTVTLIDHTTTGSAPPGYTLLGHTIEITAPVSSMSAPLRLVFDIDPAQLGTADPHTLQVLRDGQVLPDCTTPPTQACVSSRTVLGNGHAQLTVLTDHASLWQFALPNDITPPRDVPVITGTKGQNGWYRTDVTVAWHWTDSGTGINTAACTQTSTSTGEGSAITVSSTCRDKAGNSATDTRVFSIDKTKPRAAYGTHPASYTVDQSIAITCTTTDPAPSSGIASSTCSNIAGAAYSFGLGNHTYTANVTDNAGNTGSATTSFAVTVTPTSLCTLTQHLVQSSAKYQALSAKLKSAIDALVTAACGQLNQITAKLSAKQKAALITGYTNAVTTLANQGWLTVAQATALKTLVSGL
jgi:mannan endo-1,4-beta-mannosidase